MGPSGALNPELRAALLIASGDREALANITRGDDRASAAPLARAQAHIALGDLDAARDLYEQYPTSPRPEVDELLNDDWTWRFPHSIYRGHLRLRYGDERGRDDLERMLTEADRATDEGIVSADLTYWAASALAVLGRADEARRQLATAQRQGWRHAWWQKVDWNLRALG